MISFLISLGYSASLRSVMYAVGAICGIVGQFILGYFCDKSKAIKKYANFVWAFYIVIVLILYLTKTQNVIIHLLAVAGNIGFMRMLQGLIDSWILESDCNESYGFCRAFGSVGWAVGSAVISKVVETFGYQLVPIAFGLTTIISLGICYLIPDAVKNSSEKMDVKDIGKLVTNPMYMLVCVMLLGTFIMQVSLDYTIVDKMELLHAKPSQVSFYWSLSAMIELPLFFLGKKLLDKIGSGNMMLLCASVYGLRYLLYGLSTTLTQIFLISILQFITYPVMTVTSKYLILEETPENIRSSGQQVGLALYSSSSALIAPLLVGALEDSYNVNVALFVIGLFAVMSSILALIYKRRKSAALL